MIAATVGTNLVHRLCPAMLRLRVKLKKLESWVRGTTVVTFTPKASGSAKADNIGKANLASPAPPIIYRNASYNSR
jgi:hypothetical protein